MGFVSWVYVELANSDKFNVYIGRIYGGNRAASSRSWRTYGKRRWSQLCVVSSVPISTNRSPYFKSTRTRCHIHNGFSRPWDCVHFWYPTRGIVGLLRLNPASSCAHHNSLVAMVTTVLVPHKSLQWDREFTSVEPGIVLRSPYFSRNYSLYARGNVNWNGPGPGFSQGQTTGQWVYFN